MEEAAESDYVIVIDHGEIAAKGTPAELKTRYSSDTLRLFASDEAGLRRLLQDQKLDFIMSAGEFVVKLADTMSAIPVLENCRAASAAFKCCRAPWTTLLSALRERS
jgi:multidrug/hemolysin transport system ATP-binding protein